MITTKEKVELMHKTLIIYSIVSFLLTAGILIVCKLFIKSQKRKDLVLKISAILTVALHYSILYVDYFTQGYAKVGSNMILAPYPCNVGMWLLVIVAFMPKNSKIFNALAVMTFYLGIVGGVIGIVINENFLSTPTLRDYEVLKGLLSHSTMLFGAIYVLVGGYIKIRVKNLIPVVIGLCILALDGLITIALYKIFLPEISPPNSMYLLEKPFPNLPFISTYTIGIAAVVVVFIITSIVEQLTLKKEERWYSLLKKKFSKTQPTTENE